MRNSILFASLILLFVSANAFAQHNDIEFGYDDVSNPTSFVLSPLGFSTTTADGIILVKSNMETLDPFDPTNFSGDQPGFTNNFDQGLLVNPGDTIWFHALNAATESDFGVGYVNYYNPLEDRLEATGRIAVNDNGGGNTSDLILNGGSIEAGGANPQYIGIANGAGYVHDHIRWDLLDDSTAPLGAYGILAQLQSDFAPFGGGMDLSSDPFWIVFNHGMSPTDFEELALPKFGVGAIPEPASALLLGFAGLVVASRRRRRRNIA